MPGHDGFEISRHGVVRTLAKRSVEHVSFDAAVARTSGLSAEARQREGGSDVRDSSGHSGTAR